MPRRYFHPLIPGSVLPQQCQRGSKRYPAAMRASDEVLCLPIYPELSNDNVYRISALTREIVHA